MCFGLSRSNETEFTEHETGPGFPCNGSTPITGAGDRSLAGVDSRSDIREFLATRRARITPQQAGLATYGRRRRVPGLRREEVALLAGVSVDYYNRLERGNLGGVSEGVLDAIARALHLDEAEHAYLCDLARAANTTSHTRRPRVSQQQIRPGVQRILDGLTQMPAIVHNRRLDILSANLLGYALFSPIFLESARPANYARFVFLDPRASTFHPDWDIAVDSTVNDLRTEAGRNPFDRNLSDLVGELSTRSETFRKRWAAHNVRLYRNGLKRYHHPVVGELSLDYEAMEFPADTGLTLTAYSAQPGTPSHDGLNLLASWAATIDQTHNADTDTDTDHTTNHPS
jgi:transcriptional regulator with XRE-family HTH domain